MRELDLRTFLRERGVDPGDFLKLAKVDDSVGWREALTNVSVSTATFPTGADMYIAFALSPRLAGRLSEMAGSKSGLEWEWRSACEKADGIARWPELESVLGWLDPLEAELLEVGGGNDGR